MAKSLPRLRIGRHGRPGEFTGASHFVERQKGKEPIMFARLVATALVVLAAATSAGASGQQENLQVFRDVQRQVLQYPHFTIFDSVNAQVDNGTVILTGKVTMPYKRNDIERRVRKLASVERLDNRIEVLPVSQFDDDLRFRIARAIYSNPNFRPFASMVNPPIHVIVERGRVTLEGVVNSQVDRMLARSIAANFLAFDVKNELKTEAEVKAELEQL
jgi:hyperosmotically inducible periplasmic protein